MNNNNYNNNNNKNVVKNLNVREENMVKPKSLAFKLLCIPVLIIGAILIAGESSIMIKGALTGATLGCIHKILTPRSNNNNNNNDNQKTLKK